MLTNLRTNKTYEVFQTLSNNRERMSTLVWWSDAKELNVDAIVKIKASGTTTQPIMWAMEIEEFCKIENITDYKEILTEDQYNKSI
jgi:hypothetical protein